MLYRRRSMMLSLSFMALLLLPAPLAAQLLAAPVLAAPDASQGDVSITGIKPLFVGTVRVGKSLDMDITATHTNPSASLNTTVTAVIGLGNVGFDQSFPYSPAAGTSPHTVSLTGTATNPGIVEFLVTCRSGLLVDLYTLTLTVLPANNEPPVLGTPVSGSGSVVVGGQHPLFTAHVDVGAEIDLSFPATDPNPGDLLNVSLNVAAGPLTPLLAGITQLLPLSINLGVSPVALDLSGVAGEPGSLTLDVAVGDGRGGQDLISVIIVINDPAAGDGIKVSGDLQPFATAGVGLPSAAQSYLVSGSALTGPIEIAPPEHFEVSLSADSGFSTSPLVLVETGGVVAPTSIYVRFNPEAAGSYPDAIIHTSPGHDNVNLPVKGSTHGSLAAVLSAGPAAIAAFYTGGTVRALHAMLEETSGTDSFVITTLQIAIHSTVAGGIGSAALAEIRLEFNGEPARVTSHASPRWTADDADVFVTFTGLALVVEPGQQASIEIFLKAKPDALPIAKEPRYHAVLKPEYINGGAGVTGETVTGPELYLENIPKHPSDKSDSCVVQSGGTWTVLVLAAALVGVVALRRRERRFGG